MFDSVDIAVLEAEIYDLQEQIKQLTAERDTYKQALDDLGVTPAEAKAGVARSKALLAERDDLKVAAQAVVDRWDSPLWKYNQHTGNYINELRKALAKVK